MDIFQQMRDQAQAWTDAQNKLWSTWLEQLQPGQTAGNDVWTQGVERWESAVRGVLDNQAEALRQWAEQIKDSAATPDEVKRLTDQGVEAMTRFQEIQGRMWEQWFNLLKGGSQADPSRLADESAVDAWREMTERFIQIQSDWLAALGPRRDESG